MADKVYKTRAQLYSEDGKTLLGDADIQTSADMVLFDDGQTLKKKMDDLLYTAINITAFSNTVNQAEMGATVNSVTLNWNYNKVPKSLTLDGAEIDAASKSKTLTNAGIKANKTWTLKATDDRGATSSKTTTITFLNGIYWGVGNASGDGINDAFVKGLSKQLSSGRAKTFTVNAEAGKYIYYAIPARLGTPTFFVGGFEGGFALARTLDYTNPSGYKESYNVYKSGNAGLGNTTVNVQ